MDATKGLKSLLAILEAQKSRGWAAHNELDYFKPCPICGHWFDCRDTENLIKHKHASMGSFVVTTIVQTSSVELSDPSIALQSQNSPSNIGGEMPDPLPTTPASGAKP